MKTVYVTYQQNGILKKAVLDEGRYSKLKLEGVENLVIYPTEMLMEQNYSTLSGKGNNSKQILHG